MTLRNIIFILYGISCFMVAKIIGVNEQNKSRCDDVEHACTQHTIHITQSHRCVCSEINNVTHKLTSVDLPECYWENGCIKSASLPHCQQKCIPCPMVECWCDEGYELNKIDKRTCDVLHDCPYRKIPIEDGKVLTFPKTSVGQIGYSLERCFKGSGALASALCVNTSKTPEWGSYNRNSDCSSFPKLPQSASTAQLKQLSKANISMANVNPVLEKTIKLTQKAKNITEADVIQTADILYKVQTMTHTSNETLASVIDITNNILETGSGIIDTAQKVNTAANRILQSVEDISTKMDIDDNTSLRVIRPYIASVIVNQINNDNATIGISYKKTIQKELNDELVKSVKSSEDLNMDDANTAIFLSPNLIYGIKVAVTKLTFHIYSRTDLFSVTDTKFKVNSNVVAAKLEVNKEPKYDLDTDKVTCIFNVEEQHDHNVCGYWDYSLHEGAGGWKVDGCNTTDKGGQIICECNHLTNFAVLIDKDADTISTTHTYILSIITEVGLSLSILGLGFTLIFFISFKESRTGRGHQVLANLSLAMLCSSLIFLLGIQRTDNKTGCIVVAVLLHYFILVSFMWMLIEGLLQYLRFVKVFGTYIPHFMLKVMIPAWGIPLIPVITVLSIDQELYYGGNGYCWLDDNALIYAFILPVAVIICANLIVFVMVLVNLRQHRKKGINSNQSDKKIALLHLRASVSIFVILGITWVFGLLAFSEAKLVFHYLFAFTNAFQGFFIFLLFTTREKQIRALCEKFCCKCNLRDSKLSTRYTHTRRGIIDGTDTTRSSPGSTLERQLENADS